MQILSCVPAQRQQKITTFDVKPVMGLTGDKKGYAPTGSDARNDVPTPRLRALSLVL